MGIHTLRTHGSDTTVRAPRQGDVLVATAAESWEPRSLDDLMAFPFMGVLLDRMATLEAKLDAIEQALTTPEVVKAPDKSPARQK